VKPKILLLVICPGPSYTNIIFALNETLNFKFVIKTNTTNVIKMTYKML